MTSYPNLPAAFAAYEQRPRTFDAFAQAQGWTPEWSDDHGQRYARDTFDGRDILKGERLAEMEREFADASAPLYYMARAFDGRVMVYDRGVTLDTPAAEEYRRAGMRTIRDALKRYDPGYTEGNWLAPNTAGNPFDLPAYLRSESYNYGMDNPATEPDPFFQWVGAMSMAFGIGGVMAGISGALAGGTFMQGMSGFTSGLTDALGITGAGPTPPTPTTGAETTGGTMWDESGGWDWELDELAYGDYAPEFGADADDLVSIDPADMTTESVFPSDYDWKELVPEDGIIETTGIDQFDEWAASVEPYVSPPGSEVMTPEDIFAADIEDADIGRAMTKAKQAGSSFDWNKLFKAAQGELFKLVTKQTPTGTRVVPQQVRLPDGRFAFANSAGQLVAGNQRATTMPFQLTGSQIGDAVKQWAVPLGVGVGALLLWQFSQRRQA